MSKMNTKVSVIIAAFNIENYIEKCILSVINQTYDNIEIVIINDGSTDNTLGIIERYKEIDNRILLVSQKNSGIVEVRKRGLEKCNGDYILFIDGDDWLEIDSIEKLVICIENVNYDIILFNAFWCYESSKRAVQSFESNSIKIDDPLKSILLNYIKPSICFKLIRREFISKNKIIFPKNFSYGDDLAIVTSLFSNNPRVGVLNENLYNYYQRENSITKKCNSKNLDINEAIKFIKYILINKNIYSKYIAEFEFMIFNHLFIFQFLRNSIDNIYNKEIYKVYKEYNIKFTKNNYIIEYLKKQTFGVRLRILFYNYRFKLGYIYDWIRKIKIN